MGVAAFLLVVTAPLQLAVALAIKVTMGDPVLFRQERAGRGGVPFEVVKFRTMRHAAPGDDGPDTDEARLTRLGKLLRSTSIDELPTMLNVLTGDMSIVGPRPLPVRYLPRYSPEHARRHEVRPGITGWAQINGRSRGLDSVPQRARLDNYYVENWSLWRDLVIIARTIGVLFRGR